MILHLLKTSFRSIRLQPFYTGISILGISLGIATCLLMASYWTNETHFDQFHPDYESIYRVAQERTIEGGGAQQSATTFAKVGQNLISETDLLESSVRIHLNTPNTSLQAGEEVFVQDRMMGAEENFFDLFDFEFTYGSVQNWKNTPQAVVLTEEVSARLFGDMNPLGRAIQIHGSYGSYGAQGYEEFKNYTVAGVLKKLPQDTHLDFSVLISLDLYADREREFSNWGDSFYTYVKLKPEVDRALLSDQLDRTSSAIFPDMGLSFFLQPLADIHLKSQLPNEIKPNGNERALWVLVSLAFLVLVLACTNYINFTLAKSLQRRKELSLRRIFWATRGALFQQLILESLLINVIAFGFALVLLVLIHPLISTITELDLIAPLLQPKTLVLALGVWLLSSLLSGVYPAWVISGKNYKKQVTESFQTPRFQKPLLVLQFSLSVFVLAFTFLIYQQIDFMQDQELGFEVSQTVVLSGPSIDLADGDISQNLKTFLAETRNFAAVEEVATGNFIPGQTIRGSAEGYVRRLNQPVESAHSYFFTQVDANLLSNLDMKLLAGEFFNPDLARSEGLLINEEASRLLGFANPEEAIGQKIYYRRNTTPEIIGVLQDFHLFGLQKQFQPVIFEQGELPDSYLYVRYQAGAEPEVIKKLERDWATFFPGNPLQYFYLDEFFNRQYEREQSFLTSIQLFAGLAVLISFFGFYGLIYFMANARTKELAIRKTLGANWQDFVRLLGKDTVVLLILSGVLSWPLSYWIGMDWLESYAFRVSLQTWTLLLPVLPFALLIGIVVSVQAVKVYLRNPINHLRNE
ncbi:ABC transporter permease [Algoriphagus namhaensis]